MHADAFMLMRMWVHVWMGECMLMHLYGCECGCMCGWMNVDLEMGVKEGLEWAGGSMSTCQCIKVKMNTVRAQVKLHA